MPHCSTFASTPSGATVTKKDVLDHLKKSLAKWQLPDDVVFVNELPHTATGKLLKTKLRDQYKTYHIKTDND